MASEREPHEPASVIVHNLINKLTAIVGHSDLLIESTERGTEYARWLTLDSRPSRIRRKGTSRASEEDGSGEAKRWVTVPSLATTAALT